MDLILTPSGALSLLRDLPPMNPHPHVPDYPPVEAVRPFTRRFEAVYQNPHDDQEVEIPLRTLLEDVGVPTDDVDVLLDALPEGVSLTISAAKDGLKIVSRGWPV